MKNPIKMFLIWLDGKNIIYLSRSEIFEKSNRDLLGLLNSGDVSVQTGMMIVNILLERLIEKSETIEPPK